MTTKIKEATYFRNIAINSLNDILDAFVKEALVYVSENILKNIFTCAFSINSNILKPFIDECAKFGINAHLDAQTENLEISYLILTYKPEIETLLQKQINDDLEDKNLKSIINKKLFLESELGYYKVVVNVRKDLTKKIVHDYTEKGYSVSVCHYENYNEITISYV